MDLVLEISPNNLIKIGSQSLLKNQKKVGDGASSNSAARLATHYGNAQLSIVQGFSGGLLENHYGLNSTKILHRGEVEQWREAQSRSLDIIHEVQSVKNGIKKGKQDERFFRIGNPGYGRLSSRRTKFTRLARSRILSAGNIIERETGTPAHSTFVTLTIPGNTEGVGAEVARWASYLTNRVMQVVRNAKRRGVNCEYFYCWEFQKRGVLHLHLVLFSSIDRASYAVGEDVIKAWYSALKSLAESGIDLFTKKGSLSCWLPQHWQADLQPVRKSVASYVSKYVSKSESQSKSDAGSSNGSEGRFEPPRWWGMSRRLLGQIKCLSSRVVVEGLSEEACAAIVEKICKKLLATGSVVQMNQYSFEVKYGERIIGSGHRFLHYLTREFYDYFRVVLGIILCADISGCPGVSVTGNNWLYQQAKGLTVVAPEFKTVVA